MAARPLGLTAPPADPLGVRVVVRLVVGLKLRLLRNGLRRSTAQVVSLVVGLVYAAGLVALGTTGLVLLRTTGAGTAGAVVAVAGSALLLGWAVVPLVAFGADATLDPSRLAPYPLRPRPLVLGLLLAGLVGVPGAATTVLALATVVTWTRGPGTTAVALVAAVVGLLTCVAASRATTTALAGLLAGRRSREVGALMAVAVVVCTGPALSWITGSAPDLGPGALRGAARALGWSPLGWAWTAPAEVAAGRTGAGLAKLALAVALLAGLLAAWSAALQRALVSGPAQGGRTRRAEAADRDRTSPVGAALARLERAGPTGAVAARCLRYWRRDTRYLVGLVGVVALPVALVVLAAGTPAPAAAAGVGVPVVLGAMLGWGLHDDLAYDGTALWMHLSAGLPGRSDRLGRALGLLLWGAPIVAAAAVAGTGVVGRWDLLPAVLGASLGMLGAGTGVSSVASAVVPYPVPEPGANPFGARSGATLTALVVQAVTGLLTAALSVPVLVLLVLAVVLDGGTARAVAGAAALVVGLVGGAVWVAVGAARGGALLDRRGPALLALLSR